MNEIIIKGIISTDSNSEVLVDDNCLRDILIRELSLLFGEDIDYYRDNKFIENAYVSLFVADKEMSFSEMKEAKVLNDLGLTFNLDYKGWPEWTVDYFYIEDLTIGNHDLLNILRGLKGKYITLVVQQVKQ